MTPSISDISLETAARWRENADERCNHWAITRHEPWHDDGKSRVVLVRACFMAVFLYQTGNDEDRSKAMVAAREFARRNSLTKVRMFPFNLWVFKDFIGFTAALYAAGWITGTAASTLRDLVRRNEVKTVIDHLMALGEAFAPRDYTQAMQAHLASKTTI